MAFEELKEIPLATNFLANHLVDGTLTLFIGAGTSKGFGLPNWVSLVNQLRTKVGLAELEETTNADDLQNGADEVLDILKTTDALVNEIRSILYPDLDKISTKKIFKNHLLISISSLLMGSKRGHIRQVITLNYDSMLEWYLSLFGFMVRSITELPALEGSEDVRIYHPHGFIPHPTLGRNPSDFIILGQNDANLRLGNRDDPWFEKVRQILESTVCLFIGLSGNTVSDRIIAPLLASVGKKVNNIRPVGIWIFKGVLSDSKEKEFLRNNIIPIEIPKPLKISKFILGVSQEALRITNEKTR